jgi:hypothetical protein
MEKIEIITFCVIYIVLCILYTLHSAQMESSNNALINESKTLECDLNSEELVTTIISQYNSKIEQLDLQMKSILSNIKNIEDTNVSLSMIPVIYVSVITRDSRILVIEDVIKDNKDKIKKLEEDCELITKEIKINKDKLDYYKKIKSSGFITEKEMKDCEEEYNKTWDEIIQDVKKICMYNNGRFRKSSTSTNWKDKIKYLKRCEDYLNNSEYAKCTMCVADFEKLLNEYEDKKNTKKYTASTIIIHRVSNNTIKNFLKLIEESMLNAHIKHNNKLILKGIYPEKVLCSCGKYSKDLVDISNSDSGEIIIRMKDSSENMCWLKKYSAKEDYMYSTVCYTKFKIIPSTDLLTTISLDSIYPRVVYEPVQDGYYSD